MARTAIDRADARFGWMMAGPALATLFVVILFPVFWALFTSVHDYTLINPNFDSFSGAANYRHALGDPEFRHSLGLTAFFVVAVVVLEFLLGFTVALMLNTVEQMKPVYYAILLCPLLMNPVVVGLIWRMFLHPYARHLELPAGPCRHRARQLARQHQGGVLDDRHGRHLAPGVVHDRPAARRPVGTAARAL